MKKKDRIAHRVFLGLVLLGLFAVPVWTVLGPHSGVSFWEQRGLAPIPEISAERIWTGELFTDAETFFSDHVAWRDPILKANTALDLGLGRPKVNDQVVSTDKLLAAYGFSRWGLGYLGPQAAVGRINADTGLGLGALNAEDYDWETLPNPFLGSSNRKLYGLWANDDAVELPYLKESIPFTRKDRGEDTAAELFALPETAGEDVTYSVYMGGDIAETIIDTGREELPTLLLYGDSFSNPLECLLWRDFNVTYCVDFRYETEKTLDDYLEEYRPDVVLCVRDETTFLSADGNGTTGGKP